MLLGLLWAPPGPADPYVFSAPPRESPQHGQEDYGPIADYLTKATGRQFAYHHPRSWLSYIKEMRSGDYDLVFDDPHFVSWRIRALGHTPLVKLPGKLDFVVISRNHDDEIVNLQDLAGRKVCAKPLPSLGTLTMQDQFTNPIRQPQIRETEEFENIFAGLLDGRCQGAVVPSKLYGTFNHEATQGQTRILYLSPPFPNQAISAAPSIPTNIQDVIRTTLLSVNGSIAMLRLRERFADGNLMEPTGREEYMGPATLLDNYHGFK